jgi:pyruvate-ferredoxin/flavodoxin oxidoreductase
MIPNMYKIAGELTSVVFHVAARALAAQGLSIFGDQKRRTSRSSPTPPRSPPASRSSTSSMASAPLHEINKIVPLDDDDVRSLIDEKQVHAHRARGLSPEHPFIRRTAQNPNTYFQAREAINAYYQRCPELVQATMDRFAIRTGRAYQLFDYAFALSGGVHTAVDVVKSMMAGANVAVMTSALLAHGTS